MLKIILLSIGILLVFEGFLYFIFAQNMNQFLEQLSKIKPKTIKSFSTFIFLTGLCLIYFTIRFYSEN